MQMSRRNKGQLVHTPRPSLEAQEPEVSRLSDDVENSEEVVLSIARSFRNMNLF